MQCCSSASPIHLKLLGAMYIIHYLPAPSYLKKLSPEQRQDACPKWFLDEISPLTPIGDITRLDFAHLVAVSCITYIPPVPISSGATYGVGCDPFDPLDASKKSFFKSICYSSSTSFQVKKISTRRALSLIQQNSEWTTNFV
jgi:hypothetical protein